MDYKKAVDAGLLIFTSKYNIDTSIIDDLRNILYTSTTQTSPTAKVRSARPPNAYNLYIKAQFSEAKSSGDTTNSQDLMKKFSKQWSTLSTEEKAPFESQSKEQSSVAVATTGATVEPVAKVARKISGYNLFYRESKDLLKEQATAAGVKLMKHVGQVWTALSADAKKEWNDRAVAVKDSE